MFETSSKKWWRRMMFAILLLSVFTMPVAPDEDEDDEIIGPTVMQQLTREDRHRSPHKAVELHSPVRTSTDTDLPVLPVIASFDATPTLLFTPLSLAAHPLRP